MVVGELLVAMRNAELVQPPHKPAGAVEQIELILLAAVDVERLQPAEIVRLGVDRNDRVLPRPIRPAGALLCFFPVPISALRPTRIASTPPTRYSLRRHSDRADYRRRVLAPRRVGVANYLSFDLDDGGTTMAEQQKAGSSNAAQIEFWNSAASRAWADEHERMDRAVAEVTKALLDLAAPQPGEHVLDVGCGSGTTVLELAARVGPGGHVLGADISNQSVARARQRIAEAGLRHAGGIGA